MTKKNKKLHVTMNAMLYQKIKQAAREEETSMNAIAREAIRRYLR